jgi:dehydrogenase/reductase SDR family protein 12
MTGSLLDSVLDRSVIGGYTNVGYRIRRRGWSASELPSLDGRVVMVTGATSGLGLAAAEVRVQGVAAGILRCECGSGTGRED